MQPIINPMFFYWINVIGGLNVFFVCMTALMITGIFGALIARSCYSIDLEPTNVNNCKRIIKYLIAPTIIFAFLSIFTPNKNTLIQMTIANYVTSDNINVVKGEIKDTIDYIIDRVNSKNK